MCQRWQRPLRATFAAIEGLPGNRVLHVARMEERIVEEHIDVEYDDRLSRLQLVRLRGRRVGTL